MTNHTHLVVVPEESRSLAKTLREVHGRYAQYRNAIDRSSGHVWQSRFYSCAFEASRLASVMRYVELNPVRAGIVRLPEDYIWSSCVMHLGGSDALLLVDLAGWRQTWSIEEWTAVLREGTDESEAIRAATYGGRPLGSDRFVAQLERQLDRKLTPGKSGRPRKDQGNVAAA